jgi:NAD(P)-dependent dehydrogenase (short-subunit alcohol dehydrogenase family)
MALVLVTGANRGIGLEFTRQFVARGDRVIATARNPEAAHDLRALAQAHPGAIEIHRLDVVDSSSVTDFSRALADRGVDVLINNSGIYGPDRQSTVDMDFDAFAEILAVNTIAPLRVTQALLNNVRAARGKIVAISSRVSQFAEAGSDDIAYRVSKTALNRVFQALAKDLTPSGIPVLMLTPGWVRTDMGGPEAPLAVDDSVRGMIAQIDALDMTRSGQLRSMRGELLPW